MQTRGGNWRCSDSSRDSGDRPPAAGRDRALAIFSTAGALLLYFRLLRTLGSMDVASQSYLRAGVSVLLGAIVLGEQIALTTGAGLLAVILGVAAINARRPA